MINSLKKQKIICFIISVLLLLSIVPISVFAEDEEITEEDTYVFDRDKHDSTLYLYQSPCMPAYEFNNETNGIGSLTQVFVFTMFNIQTEEHFPTYCLDITVTAKVGADYRRLNLSDSSYSAHSEGRIRAILEAGFYVIPINGESDADHAARVAAKTAEIAAASGVEDLTTGEAIAATQTAIWQVVHGPELHFTNFCKSIANRLSYTKYASLCSLDEVKAKGKEASARTIEALHNYFLSLEPIPTAEKIVSPASFKDLNDPIYTKNADGSYDISVTTTVDVQIADGDAITLKAELGDAYSTKVSLVNGEQTVTLTLNNVPADLISEKVNLSVSGLQTSKGYFLFDAIGGRKESQTMVGYNNGRTPVYASVVSADERILNINKTANVAIGNDSYESRPLSNISFDVFPVATMDEYLSGAVTLPDATEYVHPSMAEYTLTTDENGRASMNFLHKGLPDGVYLIVEHPHPNVVAPIEPFYLYVPATDPTSGEKVYEITIKPKNDLKGGVHIEKDVISKGNDEASVGAYEKHTWLIGSTVPEDIATGKSYVITDTLDNRLDYLGNLVMVLEKGNEAPVPLAAGTDYTLTVTDVDSLSEGKPSDSIKIELTTEGMGKIAGIIGDNNFNSYMLRVYFDAQINANAEMGTDIPNSAELEYINSVDFKFNEKSDTPIVYTGGVNLLKVDSADVSKTLSGAVFELYRTATQDEVGMNVPGLTEIAGVVGKVVKVSFYNDATLQGDKVTSAISGEDGRVAIYGLPYGKYFLVEAKAPEGYNSLGNSLELTIGETSHRDENVITVKNESGVVLPTTGGIGTTLYTVSGIVLMCFGLVLLYLNKRKTKKA